MSKIYNSDLKKQITTLLIQNKLILNSEIVDYLNSLLELEFSVLKENVIHKELLRQFPIYKQIAIFNIYYRAIMVIKKANIEPIVLKNLQGFALATQIDKDIVSLFEFNISTNENASFIGTIHLYRMIYDKSIREQFLDETRNKLQKLYREQNPYPDLGTFDGEDLEWNFDYDEQIQFYEELLNRLTIEKQLSKEEVRKIEITKNIEQLFLEEYGLPQESFVDEFTELYRKTNNEKEKVFLKLKLKLENYRSPYSVKSNEKEITLVKKLPDIEVRDTTKYII